MEGPRCFLRGGICFEENDLPGKYFWEDLLPNASKNKNHLYNHPKGPDRTSTARNELAILVWFEKMIYLDKK